MSDAIIKWLEELDGKIDQLDRRLNNTFREGVIKQAHLDDGTYTVDAQGLETKRIPQMVQSGSVRDWSPHVAGERVIVLSPTGEPGRGIVMAAGYSNDYQQPGNQAAQRITQIGDAKITQSADGFTISVGGVTVSITGSGLTVTGGSVTHDSVNIGKDHRHSGVMPGSSPTGNPI